jgi:nucleoside-diphosphate-sugar epimerase
VFGGSQKRPNIHIDDVTDLYVSLLDIDAALIAGKTFNAGYQNQTVAEIADIVRSVVSREVPGRERVEVVTTPSNDLRSYHISSEKIRRELGYLPKRTIEDAVRDLCRAFAEGRVPDPENDARYYNVKTIQRAGLR